MHFVIKMTDTYHVIKIQFYALVNKDLNYLINILEIDYGFSFNSSSRLYILMLYMLMIEK
jgi:hypothetical protein